MLWPPATRLAGGAVLRLLAPASLQALRQSSLLTGNGAQLGILAAAGQAAGVAGGAGMMPQAGAVQSGISRTKTTLDHTAMPPQPHSSKPASGREVQWLAKVEEVKQYVEQHGRLPLLMSGSLGYWVNAQRMEYKALQQGEPSAMTPERIAALDAVPRWAWDAQDWQWQQQLEELRQYVVQHGRLPSTHATGQLGRWVTWQRTKYKALQQGKPRVMTPERIAALEAVPGWVWDAQEAHWQEMYQRVLRQVVQGGRLPKRGDRDAYHWFARQRQAYGAFQLGRSVRGYRMTAARAAALEALPGWKEL